MQKTHKNQTFLNIFDEVAPPRNPRGTPFAHLNNNLQTKNTKDGDQKKQRKCKENQAFQLKSENH